MHLFNWLTGRLQKVTHSISILLGVGRGDTKMIDLQDIDSLTAFKRNTNQYVKRLKKSRNPLVLTVNGKAELVVIDAKSFQDILEKIEYAESVKAIQEGIESFEKGEGKPARAALEEIRKKHGISR